MSTVKQKYLKDENGEIISPIVSTGSVMFSNGATLTNMLQSNVYPLQTFTKTLQLTTDWKDTGIVATNLGEGTAAIMSIVVNAPSEDWWSEHGSGVIALYNANCNSSNADEIPLSWCGHARNGHSIAARWLRQNSSLPAKLQLKADANWGSANNITFNFKRII